MTICISGCWRIQKHHFAAVQSETEAFESINISAAGRKPALRITIANRNTISWMNYSVYLLPFCPTDMPWYTFRPKIWENDGWEGVAFFLRLCYDCRKQCNMRDESCLFHTWHSQLYCIVFNCFFRQDDCYLESVSLPNLHQRNAAMYKVKVGGMKSVENDSSDDNGIRAYMVCSYMAYLRPLLRYRV